jgi:hypothetical protein
VKSADTERGFIVINQSDFQAGVHERFDGKPAKGPPNGNKDLPEGFTVENAGGAWFYGLVKGQPLKAAGSEEPIKFHGKAAAVAALRQYAAEQAEE